MLIGAARDPSTLSIGMRTGMITYMIVQRTAETTTAHRNARWAFRTTSVSILSTVAGSIRSIRSMNRSARNRGAAAAVAAGAAEAAADVTVAAGSAARAAGAT